MKAEYPLGFQIRLKHFRWNEAEYLSGWAYGLWHSCAIKATLNNCTEGKVEAKATTLIKFLGYAMRKEIIRKKLSEDFKELPEIIENTKDIRYPKIFVKEFTK